MQEISFNKNKMISIRVSFTDEKILKEVAQKRNMSVSKAIITVMGEEWLRLQRPN